MKQENCPLASRLVYFACTFSAIEGLVVLVTLFGRTAAHTRPPNTTNTNAQL